MAAKFTAGDSMHTTIATVAKVKPGEPKTHSETLKKGNTMSGAPGYINTGANSKEGGMAKGSKAMKTVKANSGLSVDQREVGSRTSGSNNGKKMNMPGKKATGTMRSGKMESLKGKANTSWERPGKGKSLMY